MSFHKIQMSLILTPTKNWSPASWQAPSYLFFLSDPLNLIMVAYWSVSLRLTSYILEPDNLSVTAPLKKMMLSPQCMLVTIVPQGVMGLIELVSQLWWNDAGSSLVQVITAVVNGWLQWARHVYKTLSQHSFQPLALHCFCLLFCDVPSALKDDREHPLRKKHFIDTALWPVMSHCINHCPLQNEASLMKPESSTNLWA